MAVEFLPTVEGTAPPRGPYSMGVKVTGTLVFVAGQLETDESGQIVPGGAGAQARQCLRNIQRVLEAAGSSMDKVFKVSIFLTNMDDLPEVSAARREVWQGPFPAATTVEVSRLAHPDAVIEIEAVAVL